MPLSQSSKVSGSHFPYFSRVRLGFTRVRVPRTLPALILMHLAESWQKNPQVRSHTFTVGGPLRTSPFIFPFSSNPTLAPVGTPFFLATYSGFSLSCLHESCCCSMVCVYLQRNTCSCVSIICSLSAYATKLLRFMRVRNMPPCLWHHRHPAQCLEPSRDQTYSSTDQLPPASEAS